MRRTSSARVVSCVLEGIDIADAKARVKDGYASSMTLEEHKAFCEMVDGLSDKEIKELYATATKWYMDTSGGITNDPQKQATVNKRLAKLHQDYLIARGLRPQDTAAWQMKSKPLPDDINQQSIRAIKRSNPSDYIYLTYQEDEFLIDLWESGQSFKNGVLIPADLFWANTVPMMDCVISIDERGCEIGNGRIVQYRIVIFEEAAERIKLAQDTESDLPVTVGAVIPYHEGFSCYFPITTIRGLDWLVSDGEVGWFAEADKDKIKLLQNGSMRQECISLMETWYGIQIALLHPAVKDVFAHPQRTAVDSAGGGNHKKRKRKVKYIRKHILTLDKLEEVSQSKEQRKINRKCLAWYVIGHWRTYKSGKKVFVSPYWKGALRNLRKNADGDEREREL